MGRSELQAGLDPPGPALPAPRPRRGGERGRGPGQVAGALRQGGPRPVPGVPVHPGHVHLHSGAALAQLGPGLTGV